MKAETKRENHRFTNQQRDLPAGSVLASARGRRGRKLPRLQAPGSCPALPGPWLRPDRCCCPVTGPKSLPVSEPHRVSECSARSQHLP